MSNKRYNGPPTAEVYPDSTIPGYLVAIRNGTTSIETAASAYLYGAELRTRRIAAERLDAEDTPVSVAPECQWFALCDHPATTTRPHPILGDVPICDRCNAKCEELS